MNCVMRVCVGPVCVMISLPCHMEAVYVFGLLSSPRCVRLPRSLLFLSASISIDVPRSQKNSKSDS